VEHEVGVDLDGVMEGWVAVERNVALPPPPRRAARGIRLLHQGGDLLLHRGCLISSPPSWPISFPSPSARAPPSRPPSLAASSCSSKPPLFGRRPLSLSHHSSPSSSTVRGAACHDTLTAAHSSSSQKTSRSGMSCRSMQRLRSQARRR
jgi:hypothetical protein